MLEAKVPDLINIPKQIEHASVVGDHLNFHLINPTEEENLAFQVGAIMCFLPLRVDMARFSNLGDDTNISPTPGALSIQPLLP